MGVFLKGATLQSEPQDRRLAEAAGARRCPLALPRARGSRRKAKRQGGRGRTRVRSCRCRDGQSPRKESQSDSSRPKPSELAWLVPLTGPRLAEEEGGARVRMAQTCAWQGWPSKRFAAPRFGFGVHLGFPCHSFVSFRDGRVAMSKMEWTKPHKDDSTRAGSKTRSLLPAPPPPPP